MTNLSLAMIVKDEEKNLPQALSRAREYCNEMIVVDTGSKDNTIQIARDLGAIVYVFPGQFNFCDARNFAVAKTSLPWWTWLDADDDVSEESVRKINEMKRNMPDTQGVWTTYRMTTGHENSRERFIKADSGFKWEGAIHETVNIPPDKKIFRRDIVIQHLSSAHHGERNMTMLWKEYYAGNKSQKVLFHLIQELILAGQFEDCLRIVAEYPAAQTWHTYQIQIYAGKACMGLEKHEDARLWFSKAQHFDPRRAEAWIEMGLLFAKLGKPDMAIPYFSAALYLKPIETDESICNMDCYTWMPPDFLGAVLGNMGRNEEAIQMMTKSIVLKEEKNRDRVRGNITNILNALQGA